MKFLQALAGKNTAATPPIWLMRQAGRYMRAYRKLRAKYSFTQLCLTAELAVQVALQPIQAFDFDAAIVFSDILFPLMALGAQVTFPESGGPQVSWPGWSPAQEPENAAARLRETIPAVYHAVSMLSQSLDKPVIGFSGAPWTLAAYLIENGSSTPWKTVQAAKKDPEFPSLIAALERLIIAHLNLQIEAGCSAVQIFDSRALCLSEADRLQHSIEPTQRIFSQLLPCPTIFYQTDAPMGATAISCSSSVRLSSVRAATHTPIQGNLDPVVLQGPTGALRKECTAICKAMKNDPAFIFNLSGGVLPSTPEENVRLLVDSVRREVNYDHG